jgi:dTDP-4-amino-4,6-dideoxygalactose transaminase
LRIERRNELATLYAERLGTIPGITFPRLRDGDRSTYKDLTILVDADGFGLDADGLARELGTLGVDTRRYYAPPVHRMRAYRGSGPNDAHLSVTDSVSERVLTLPMWSEMRNEDVVRVADTVRHIHDNHKRSG